MVFVASFAIPLLKLARACVWLLMVGAPSARPSALKLKTKLHHTIHEVGRWSMVDVLAIGTFVPLMQFDQIANAQAMPGIVPRSWGSWSRRCFRRTASTRGSYGMLATRFATDTFSITHSSSSTGPLAA